jgi:hypothetical protein
LLFAGDRDGAFAAYDEAIAAVPSEARSDVLSSVLGPLQNYLTAGVLSGQLADDVKTVIERLQAAAKTS